MCSVGFEARQLRRTVSFKLPCHLEQHQVSTKLNFIQICQTMKGNNKQAKTSVVIFAVESTLKTRWQISGCSFDWSWSCEECWTSQE